MSHSGVRVAYFACPHDQGWSEGDDENPTAWEFTVVHYQKLLKVGVAWAKLFTTPRAANTAPPSGPG